MFFFPYLIRSGIHPGRFITRIAISPAMMDAAYRSAAVKLYFRYRRKALAEIDFDSP
jgi:hypothetical protein